MTIFMTRQGVVHHKRGHKRKVTRMSCLIFSRVVGYISPGETVDLAQRIGKITLGSQVDLVMTRNPDLAIVVKPGQHVKAGQTIIAATSLDCKTSASN